MSKNRITIRGLAVVTAMAASTATLTIGVNAWAAEPTAAERPVTHIGDLPAGAHVTRAAPPYGERLADIKAGQKRKAARLAAVKAARIAAERREAAERAAAEARQAREAEARAARSAARQAPTYSGDPRGIAADMAASRYGWGAGEFDCLNSLWGKESGWDPNAENPSSGAYGIPQALPGSKMSTAGSDWQSNPATQIEWGLGYIKSTYGSPCSAWSTSQSQGWY